MLNNIRIRTRLLILILVPLLGLTVVTTLSLQDMRSMNQSTQDLLFEMDEQSLLASMREEFTRRPLDALAAYQAGEYDEPRASQALQGALERGEESLAQFHSDDLPEEEVQLLDNMEPHYRDLAQWIGNEGYLDSDASLALLEITRALDGYLNQLIEMQEADARAFAASVEQQFAGDLTLLLALISLISLAVVGIAVVIYRSINQPLNHLTQVMGDIEHDANLTLRARVDGNNELGQLADRFNKMMGYFQDVLLQIDSASHGVAAASEQLSVISRQLNNTTTDQEDRTAQIATAITEMASAVEEVANNAQNALTATEEADKKVRSGLEEVDTNRKTMDEMSGSITETSERLRNLNEWAQEITGVMDVIQKIAEQTNLLALNAAIEAARAGEQGRGFAVVADEVRNLASNTHKSTEQIQKTAEGLSKGANEAVTAMAQLSTLAGESVESSHRTGAAFEDVGDSVTQVVEVNVQISTATEEQAAVAKDISESVNTLSSSVSEVVTGSGQCSESSSELSKLAQQLRDQVARFQVS